MKILMLDLFEPEFTEKDRVAGFWNLAETEFDASIIRIPLLQMGGDPEAYREAALSGLKQAEVIVSLGNMMLVQAFGQNYGFFDLLKEKIAGGTPFFFQFSRAWERYYNPHGGGRMSQNTTVRELFRFVGVSPTPIKVFSTDTHESDWSGASTWFRAGDDLFTYPEIFGGIQKILLTGANLLRYGDGCFRLVEVGPLHELVDDEDKFTNLPADQRKVVAVVRDHEKQKGLIFGGNLASDRTKLVGGWRSGFDENEEVVRSVLKYLAHRADTAENRSQEAYKLFDRLERELSRLVFRKFDATNDPNKILLVIPEEVAKKLPIFKGSRDPSYLTYLNLVDLVLKNWERFSPLFAPNSKSVTKKALQSVNYGVRRYVAHPHRAESEGYTFATEDLRKLEGALSIVKAAALASSIED